MIFCYLSVSITWKNSLGTFGLSFNYNSSSIDALVYGWSLFNSSMRIIIGYISDYFILQSNIIYPRVIWLYITGILTVVTLCMYFIVYDSIVWLITFFIASLYASSMTIIATLISILFGVKHFGFNMGLISFIPGFGGLIYTYISTIFINNVTNDDNCVGNQCFINTFILFICTITIGIIISYIQTNVILLKL